MTHTKLSDAIQRAHVQTSTELSLDIDTFGSEVFALTLCVTVIQARVECKTDNV